MATIAADPWADEPFFRQCRQHLICPSHGNLGIPATATARLETVPSRMAATPPVPIVAEPPEPTAHERLRAATRAKRRRAT